jgi:hypothetical protein
VSAQEVSAQATQYNVSAEEKLHGDTLVVSPKFADFSVLRQLEFTKNICILIMQRIIHVFKNLI